MPEQLRSLREDEADFGAMARAVEAISRGTDPKQTGVIARATTPAAHRETWATVLRGLASVNQGMFRAYQGIGVTRLEEVMAASRSLAGEVPDSRREAAKALAANVLESVSGAKHTQLVRRLGEAWEASPGEAHPAIAFAVKGALFQESLPAAQVAYFHHEWQASLGKLLHPQEDTLEVFLSEQPTALLRVQPHHDPDSPFLSQRHQHG